MLGNDFQVSDNESEMNFDSAVYRSSSVGHQQSGHVNVLQPFEVDKVPSLKNTTTSSGRKNAEDVYKMFEMQYEGMYKCMLCPVGTRVSSI